MRTYTAVRRVLGCPLTTVHAAHGWRSARAGAVDCDGLDHAGAAIMKFVALRDAFGADGKTPRTVSIRVQLLVVDFCAHVACAVPTLDSVADVARLIDTHAARIA